MTRIPCPERDCKATLFFSGGLLLRNLAWLCFFIVSMSSARSLAQDESSIQRSRFKDIQRQNPFGTTTDSVAAPQRTEAGVTAPSSRTGKSFFGQFRIENMQYLTEIEEAPELTNTSLLSGRLSGADYWGETSTYSYGVDITAGTYFSWRQSHYFVNELYIRADYSDSKVEEASSFLAARPDITMGRRKFDWSELDHRWQLGMWQPKFTLDALRPEDQGLTGFFYNQKSTPTEILVMATPIFIPTIGPDVREEGGSIVSDSRWYRRPSNRWNFNDQETPIVYSLDTPDIERLVMNPGLATMMRWGSKTEGLRFTVGGAYKPVNDLILKRQNFQVINETKVTVRPEVTKHRLYSADLGYTRGIVNTSISFLGDDPEEKRPEEDWVIQRLRPTRMYSANFDIELSQYFNRPLQVQTSYLKVYGGEIEDIGVDGTPDDMTLFDTRLKFTNAIMTRVMGEVGHPWGRPLSGRFSYIYDYDQKGSIWGLEFQYFPADGWGLVVGADLLGVEDETDADKRFINQYRANDRYYGGLSYVF